MANNIITRLISAFKSDAFTLKQAYEVCEVNNPESVRARIYENLGDMFTRIDKGVYEATIDGLKSIFIEGDGRDLSFLSDDSVDAIITDYPWLDETAHKGGNRNFANDYAGFKYSVEDFLQKYRVLKNGSFLVEFMPSETESNWEELARIKKLAVQVGFKYYAKVPYIENKVRNTGRTSKAGGDVLIFSKGKARALRPDAKKNKANGVDAGYFMSGANGMLPVSFDAPLPPKKELKHQSMKSVELIKSLLEYFTKVGDLVLDQFAGSFSTAFACDELDRYFIGIEKDATMLEKAKTWFKESGKAALCITNNLKPEVENSGEEVAETKATHEDWKSSRFNDFGIYHEFEPSIDDQVLLF